MKYISLVLLLAVSAALHAQAPKMTPEQAKIMVDNYLAIQKLSEPTWNLDGTYTCPIGEVCRTPTQKEIDTHKLTGTFVTEGINWTKIDDDPCGFWSFKYDAKSNTCEVTIDFQTPNNEPLKCSELHAVNNSNLKQEIVCFYTPKKTKP